MIGQVNSKFFGKGKPTLPWVNLSGLPPDKGYTPPPLSGSDPNAPAPSAAPPSAAPPSPPSPDLPTGDLDIQPPPAAQPSYNPYTQKQADYQAVYDRLNQFSTWAIPYLESFFSQTGEFLTYNDALRDNEFSEKLNEINEFLTGYGFSITASPNPTGAEDLVQISSPTGEMAAPMSLQDALAWFGSETTRLGDAATRHDEFTGFMEGLQEWAFSYEAGETQVDPFADPNGWGALVKDIFGDTAALPDIQDLLMGMYDLMPVWNYTADALPNLTAPERTAKFFDDLKANGFDMEQMQGGLDQELRDWLYKMAQELQPSRMFEQLDLDLSTWNQMTSAQIAEITKMIGRKSVFDDADTRKYLELQMREIKNINRDEYNAHLNVLAEKGITHGGAVVRSAQELSQRLTDAEMTATSELFMRGVELAEQGRWEAMGTWSQINDTQAELLLSIGGLKTTLFGQYFSFLQGIGNISASEFSTATQAHVAKATLKLKYELGVAGLEMDQYISEGVLNLEGLKLEYENYWRDRGADLKEKQAEFDNAIAAWQTSSMMAEMINSGRTERLVQMADLALKAQSGDREAWGMYQQLALRETLEQRGMDIDQALAVADLTFQYYTFGETMDFNRWAIKYDTLLKKELLRMNIQGKKDLIDRQAELEDDGFWGTLFDIAGSAAKLGAVLF
jgi:hypothetical protein